MDIFFVCEILWLLFSCRSFARACPLPFPLFLASLEFFFSCACMRVYAEDGMQIVSWQDVEQIDKTYISFFSIMHVTTAHAYTLSYEMKTSASVSSEFPIVTSLSKAIYQKSTFGNNPRLTPSRWAQLQNLLLTRMHRPNLRGPRQVHVSYNRCTCRRLHIFRMMHSYKELFFYSCEFEWEEEGTSEANL
jgi:hypothetical protein